MLLALVAPAWALDLDEARSAAVGRALEVQRAEATADAARARAGAALAEVLPAVVGFGDISTGAGFTSFGFPRPVSWQAGVGVEASWRILAPSDWAAAAAARRTARGQEAMVRWARVDARRAATVAYAEAWAAASVVEARAIAAEGAAQAAVAVRSLVDAGLRPPVDAARAEAAAEGALAVLAEVRAQAVSRCAELQGLILVEIDGRCELVPVSTWGEAAEGEGTHPAIVAAREAWLSTRASRGAARWALGPAVSLRGTAAEYLTEGSAGLGWSVGARAELPIGDPVRWAELSVAGAEVDEARAALAAQEQAIAIARLSAEARLQAAREALEALVAADAAAQEALRLTDERYRVGLDGITAWIDARRVRDDAAAALARGRAAVGAALAEVESARGVW